MWFARFSLVSAAKLTLLLTATTVAYLAFSQAGAAATTQLNDKVVHFCAFFVLAALMHIVSNRPLWQQALLLVLYGGSIEIVQSFLAYRSASFLDLWADTTGICAYYCTASLLIRLRSAQPG